jgi:hypothetical protein
MAVQLTACWLLLVFYRLCVDCIDGRRTPHFPIGPFRLLRWDEYDLWLIFRREIPARNKGIEKHREQIMWGYLEGYWYVAAPSARHRRQ